MLGVTDYVAFVAAFFMLLILPGPGTLALIASTSYGGVKGGLLATLGIIAGDQVLLWMAAGGVAAVLHAWPVLFRALQWAGAAYLVWLGAQMLFKKPEAQGTLKFRPGRYFRQTALITVLNPKAIFFYMAFFPQFISPETHRGLVTFSFMAATVIVITFIYCSGLVLVVQHLADRIRANHKLVKWVERLAGSCLVGFGLKLFLAR